MKAANYGIRITPECIDQLKLNQIFVFGSNEAGRHGKGAALWALRQFEAVYGQGEGLQGRSYGIPTKNAGRSLETLPIARINAYVRRFLGFARSHPELEFLVTPVGTGLAGYMADDIAPLFISQPEGLPANVWLPRSFWKSAGKIS